MEKASVHSVLENYKKKFDIHLKAYLDKKEEQAEKVDELAVQIVQVIRKFVMSGGKRLRPFLVYQGYLAAGGEDGDAIITASMSIELAHAFLLMHDDIIDRDAVRHGEKTVHEIYIEMGRGFGMDEKEARHFGNSMAIIVGDYAYSMANDILYGADFSAEVILHALRNIQKIVSRTIPGQMVDMMMSAKGSGTEGEVMRMYEGKTARYTFEGPLHLGCSLAGQWENEKLLENFSAYAVPVGTAYQIRDDILGVFGDKEKTGKAVGADIIEGKQTILITKSRENANKQQKLMLSSLVGKKDLSASELEAVRAIIRETGALEYAEKLSSRLVDDSLLALRGIDSQNQDAIAHMESIAKYIIKREV